MPACICAIYLFIYTIMFLFTSTWLYISLFFNIFHFIVFQSFFIHSFIHSVEFHQRQRCHSFIQFQFAFVWAQKNIIICTIRTEITSFVFANIDIFNFDYEIFRKTFIDSQKNHLARVDRLRDSDCVNYEIFAHKKYVGWRVPIPPDETEMRSPSSIDRPSDCDYIPFARRCD